MAFFGSSWFEDEEHDRDIGPLSHWLEDHDFDYIKDPGEPDFEIE